MADSIWGTGRRLDASLLRAPYQFEFFQAVRLLALLERESGRKRNDAIRFKVHTSMSFPPSPVVEIKTKGSDDPVEMTVAFLGLIGPIRMLPDRYTELALQQKAFGDASFAAFFDVFHHRLIALYYRAWEKHQFVLGQEQARGGRDAITGYLLDLIGMGTPGLEGRMPFPEQALLRYTGLLAQRPRSAECLRAMLHDYLGVSVAIKQFCGRWHVLDEEELCALGSGEANSQLGEGAAAGDMVWNLQSLIHVVLGPLAAEDFFEFLPDGRRFEPLTALVRWFLGPAIDFEVQAVLAAGVTPDWNALGATEQAQPRARLGWSGWLTEQAFAEPAGDAVFAEHEYVEVARWQ